MMRGLCDFLGVEWTPELRVFDETAQRRGVTAASIGQVRRRLYDGRRQWAPYAAQMNGVMPILQLWVEKFGFGM